MADQSITVPFGNGDTIPIDVTITAGETPPSGELKPSSHTFGTQHGEQFTVTLTPGAVVNPNPTPPPTPPTPPTPSGVPPIQAPVTLASQTPLWSGYVQDGQMVGLIHHGGQMNNITDSTGQLAIIPDPEGVYGDVMQLSVNGSDGVYLTSYPAAQFSQRPLFARVIRYLYTLDGWDAPLWLMAATGSESGGEEDVEEEGGQQADYDSTTVHGVLGAPGFVIKGTPTGAWHESSIYLPAQGGTARIYRNAVEEWSTTIDTSPANAATHVLVTAGQLSSGSGPQGPHFLLARIDVYQAE